MRKLFKIVRRSTVGYDVECLYCKKVSKAWDYRMNALGVGYAHVSTHIPGWLHEASWVDG